MAFMGEYRHNTDSKGRIIMPARFRDALGSSMILTKGLDGCIYVYTHERWEAILAELQKLPATKSESRKYMRLLTAKAAEVEVDNTGRILIPQALMEDAGIRKEVVIVGVVSHVEIWAKARWDEYAAEAGTSFEAVAETLTEYFKG
jgi:MraZ protein